MSYLLDANTYIQAKNHHYRMGFCPGYWDWLDSAYASGKIASIQLVYKELIDYEDDLSEWARQRNFHFLPIDDEATQSCFAKVAEFVMNMPNPSQGSKAEFLSGADPWLVAKAMNTGATVVTHEALVPPISKKIKIPNICREFGVPYMGTFDLLEELSASLVMGKD